MKIRPVGAKLFHAGGETDRHDEANSRFLQFFECLYNATIGLRVIKLNKMYVVIICHEISPS